jgi:ABC-type branched-subunit amino acid transport system substrate-binding protein
MKIRGLVVISALFLSSAVYGQLTVSERRGKQIYLRGVSPSGQEISGRIGEIDVPAGAATCSGCHGMRGEGKTEGGVTAGGLTWSNLVKPYGHTHPTGRTHGPFTESSFIRAVVNGVDSSGNPLLVAMPRYNLSPADMADLIAYLKRIETDLDPGLTDNSLTVGLVVPSQGPFADVGAAMKDVFNAYFDDVNSRGGIFSRKIEMRIADAGAGGAATATTARDFVRKEQVFAFVGGLTAGADDQVAAFARAEEIPFIGPSTLLPHAENPVNRYLFYLLPGVGEQAVSLVNFAAARPELRRASAAIVYDDNSLGVASAAAAETQLKSIGWTSATKQSYTSASFDARRMVDGLKSEGVDVVFFFGGGREQSSLLTAAAAAGWTPNFFFLGVLSGKELPPESTAALKDKIFIAFPTVPADVTSAGMAEFRTLHEKYKFAPRHTAAQLSAFAAAKVFVEALTRAGRELSREKLVNTFEGFYDYDTGVTPRITFGPNRRVGAAGAHVVSIALAEKAFATATGWIKAY